MGGGNSRWRGGCEPVKPPFLARWHGECRGGGKGRSAQLAGVQTQLWLITHWHGQHCHRLETHFRGRADSQQPEPEMMSAAATSSFGAAAAPAARLCQRPIVRPATASRRAPGPLNFKADDAITGADFRKNAGLARLLRGYAAKAAKQKLEPWQYQVARRALYGYACPCCACPGTLPTPAPRRAVRRWAIWVTRRWSSR